MSALAFAPWTASIEKRPAPASGHWYVVLGESENGIGEFYGEDHDANVANLRLAAAAPELYEALEGVTAFLKHAPLESGVCCCGSPVEGHGYSDGHSPVDELQYHAGGLADKLDRVLAKARGEA